MEVRWGGGVGWWETLVSQHPIYPTLPDTTGPKKLFCRIMGMEEFLGPEIEDDIFAVSFICLSQKVRQEFR